MSAEEIAKIKELINRRRRQLTIHSFIYYQLNENIISDYTFDKWCNELVELQAKYPDIAKEVPYASEFEDFDGSTGYHLPFGYPEFQSTAHRLLNYHKKAKTSGK